MLPNFLCIGAPKSGTTTLYDVLKQHSDIFALCRSPYKCEYFKSAPVHIRGGPTGGERGGQSCRAEAPPACASSSLKPIPLRNIYMYTN